MALRRGRGDIIAPVKPVPGKPVVSYPTPNIVDLVVTETVQVTPKNYQPLAYGTPHPSNKETGVDLRLVWQSSPTGSDAIRSVQRIYATPHTSQDVYNYAQKFSEESNAHPVYIRTYFELRANYAPLPKNARFTGIIAAKVTVGGSKYDPDNPPTVNVSGGGGSGALLRPIIYDGAVAYLQIIAEGSNYTSAPTISFSSAHGGSGATAVCVVQPQGCELVAEEMQRIDNEDPKMASLFVRVHRTYKVIPGPQLVTKRIGQPNLTPEKYRRLVRSVETDQLVRPDYNFPTGLVGNQSSIEHQQQTVAEARLKIIEEIVAATNDALLGGETSPYGPLRIYEYVVNEGEPIDAGYLVLKSTITPFGNGKAVKITVKYPENLAELKLLEKTIGQDNLIPAKYKRLVRHQETNQLLPVATYNFPSSLVGNQSEITYVEESIYRARLKVAEEVVATTTAALSGQETDDFGIDHIEEAIVNEGEDADSGFLIKSSKVSPFGNGKAVKITVFYPSNLGSIVLTDSPYEEELHENYSRTRQIVDASYTSVAPPGGVGAFVELEQIDLWHKRKTSNSFSPPVYNSSANALQSWIFRPYTFPGRLNITVASLTSGNAGFITPRADLVKIRVRTWWVVSSSTPSISVPEIITDSLVVQGKRFDNVLHDPAVLVYNLIAVFYPATTPGFSEFYGFGLSFLSDPSTFTAGSDVISSSVTLHVGDQLGIGIDAIVITAVLGGGTYRISPAWPFASYTGPAIFTPRAGTPWYGNEKIIAASVEPARQKNLWKLQTQEVVMR